MLSAFPTRWQMIYGSTRFPNGKVCPYEDRRCVRSACSGTERESLALRKVRHVRRYLSFILYHTACSHSMDKIPLFLSGSVLYLGNFVHFPEEDRCRDWSYAGYFCQNRGCAYSSRLLTSTEFVVKYAQEALFRQTSAGEGIVKQPVVSTERNRTASDRVTVSESIRVMKQGGKGKRISKNQNSLAVLKRRNER